MGTKRRKSRKSKRRKTRKYRGGDPGEMLFFHRITRRGIVELEPEALDKMSIDKLQDLLWDIWSALKEQKRYGYYLKPLEEIKLYNYFSHVEDIYNRKRELELPKSEPESVSNPKSGLRSKIPTLSNMIKSFTIGRNENYYKKYLTETESSGQM
jgi:hypothetical protein